jgi:hypothetical protein
MEQVWQGKKARLPGAGPARGWELVIPNPKLKLMDPVREVLRVAGFRNPWFLPMVACETTSKTLPVAISTKV